MSTPYVQIKRNFELDSQPGRMKSLEPGELGYMHSVGGLFIGMQDTTTKLLNIDHQLDSGYWTNGTTAGPQLNLTSNDSRSHNENLQDTIKLPAIPAASEIISGIITTGGQIFSGDKTFKGELIASSDFINFAFGEIEVGVFAATMPIGVLGSYVNAEGFIYDNGSVAIIGDNIVLADNLDNPTIGWTIVPKEGIYSLGILSSAGDIFPGGDNLYDLGGSTRFWANIYAKNSYNDAILLSSGSSYLTVSYSGSSARNFYIRDHGQNAYSVATSGTSAVGSSTKPVYINANGIVAPIDSYEGNAASASKLTNTTPIGSNIQPVYFTNEGVPLGVTAIGLSYGGTGNNLSSSNANSIIQVSTDRDKLIATPTQSGAIYVTASNGVLNFGTLPLAYGGTGNTFATTSNNAIIVKSSSGLSAIATASGAAYATSANGTLQFGTLPIAQGGTGATSASTALTNLGGAPINHASSNNTYGVATTSAYGHVKITTGNGLVLSSGTLSMNAASSSAAGAVTTDSQTFAGQKTFSGILVANSDIDSNGRIILDSNCYGTVLPTTDNTEGRIFFLKLS